LKLTTREADRHFCCVLQNNRVYKEQTAHNDMNKEAGESIYRGTMKNTQPY